MRFGAAFGMHYIPSVSAQAPSAVILVRAEKFLPNPATAADNAFQRDVPSGQSDEAVSATALAEMDALADALRQAGVRVHVFADEDHTRPDSVFPNNWLSTHAGGYVAVYPMYASNRRHERRADVLEMLKSDYRVQAIVDYSGLEPDGIFLEGTGAMVLDHVSRVAYTARSHRADIAVLERFCTDFGYEPMAFDAVDSEGVPVYHTNVIACIGTDVAMIALEMIPDAVRREQVRERLSVTGRTIVELTEDQIREFAGNAVELCGRTPEGKRRYVMAMSARARRSLRPEQVAAIEESCEIVAVDIPTIELAGGSVRCMIAGVHLDRRPTAEAEPTALVEAIDETAETIDGQDLFED
ncbi:amidinotransferase [Knoellia flava TL1]|uniref:Amidinotransferase n=2 Tax=Knoellia flava TaxID=913969 RepID=A0A8H9FYD9_9MICO|nr:amidinotransferase [Knoellia flava TL1]GGB89011.1 amidinotransferase [Knoellia flava]